MRGLVYGVINHSKMVRVRPLLPYSMVAAALPLEPKMKKVRVLELQKGGMLDAEAEHAQKDMKH